MNTRLFKHTVAWLLVCAVLLSVPASLLAARAEDEIASSVKGLVRAIQRHTDKAEDAFTIRLTPELTDKVFERDNDLISAIMRNSGVFTGSFEWSVTGSVRTVTFHDLTYYSGQRILAAYRAGNAQARAMLTAREQETLMAADKAIQSFRSGSDLDKEKAVHDYLCNTVTYDASNPVFGEQDTAIGALLNRRADCDGISDAFFLMCSMLGIETRRVSGNCNQYRNASGHMWNAVCIDGTWCFVDVTTDHQSSDELIYTYYNIGAQEISSTHTWLSEALDIDVIPVGGKDLRNESLGEDYVSSWEEADAAIYAQALSKPQQIRLLCSPAFSLNSDPDRMIAIIYTSGITGASYSQNGNTYEILNIQYYNDFRRVHSQQEALEYAKDCKKHNLSEFTLLCPDSLYKELMANNASKVFQLLTNAGYSKRSVSFIEQYGHIIISNAS